MKYLGTRTAATDDVAVQNDFTEDRRKIAALDAAIGTLREEADNSNYVRTDWEQVNGLASLEKEGTTGSYAKTKEIIAETGVINDTLSLTFNSVSLTFNSQTLDWHYTGAVALNDAFFSLREFLRNADLYGNADRDSFSREEMARLFTQYNDMVAEMLFRSFKKFATDKDAVVAADLAAFKTSTAESLSELESTINSKYTELKNYIDGKYTELKNYIDSSISAMFLPVTESGVTSLKLNPSNYAGFWTEGFITAGGSNGS